MADTKNSILKSFMDTIINDRNLTEVEQEFLRHMCEVMTQHKILTLIEFGSACRLWLQVFGTPLINEDRVN